MFATVVDDAVGDTDRSSGSGEWFGWFGVWYFFTNCLFWKVEASLSIVFIERGIYDRISTDDVNIWISSDVYI